ncbi:hypothetical protein BGX26_012667 [Mortierella sp. AD094]|nr:hypothetical protein BGX26_012667 [Mortierella sp. AD094]
MGDEVDKKPEAGSAEHINLKVVGQDHSEVFFKIKRSTQLKKLMEAYCDRQGKAVTSVRFLYDGERIQPTNTPNELEMEDGDSIDVMVEQWAKHHYSKPNNPPEEKTYETERDILIKNHRFLRSEKDDQDLTWEKRVAKKYDDKLFKEFALVELKHYKEGRIAMRWRTEKELFRGKGQFTCGSLGCDDPDGLKSWEVNFGYMEQGEKKNALVKIRLCEGCSYKLNYKTKHKRAPSHQDEHASHSSITHKSPEGRKRRHSSDGRSKSEEKDMAIKGDAREELRKADSNRRKRSRRREVSDNDEDTTESHKGHQKLSSSQRADRSETGDIGLSPVPKASQDKDRSQRRFLFE